MNLTFLVGIEFSIFMQGMGFSQQC